jgi:hypothetical protein
MIDRRDCRGNRWHPQRYSTQVLALEVQLADLECRFVREADLAACLSWRERAAQEIERRSA